MARVLVLWADNYSANLGVRVLAQGMASLARSAWGPGTIVDFQDFGAGDSEMSFGTRSIASDIGRPDGPIKVKLRPYDAIIDSGAGDSFTDIYGPRRLLTMHYVHRLAARLDIPLIFGPQTIGPFNRRWGQAVAKRSLKGAASLLVRDSISDTYVRELGFVPNAHATDVVFNLPVPKRAHRFDVLFNVSGLLWHENAHVDYVKYRADVQETIQALLESGRDVSLLAHVLTNGSRDDDTVVAQELGSQLGLRSLIPGDLADVRTMVADSNLVIGSRMHACLNALSVGTPSIPLAYSRKFAPLLNDIGWTHTIDLRDSASVVNETVAVAKLALAGALDTELSELRDRTAERLDRAVAAMQTLLPVPIV